MDNSMSWTLWLSISWLHWSVNVTHQKAEKSIDWTWCLKGFTVLFQTSLRSQMSHNRQDLTSCQNGRGNETFSWIIFSWDTYIKVFTVYCKNRFWVWWRGSVPEMSRTQWRLDTGCLWAHRPSRAASDTKHLNESEPTERNIRKSHKSKC